MWVVPNMTFFDDGNFKVLYFELLKILWECFGGNQPSHEQILKTLFLFHGQLQQDYLQWYELNQQQGSRSSHKLSNYGQLNHPIPYNKQE